MWVPGSGTSVAQAIPPKTVQRSRPARAVRQPGPTVALPISDMKNGIHPAYRSVVFQDMSTGTRIITRSTASTRETVKMDDGKEYPLIKLDVTSDSHPFYTGAQQRISETGRVERFRQRFSRIKGA